VWRREFSFNLVVYVSWAQVNFLLKWTPSYFVVREVGIRILLNVIRGQVPCLTVKVIWVDLISLIFNFQFFTTFQCEKDYQQIYIYIHIRLVFRFPCCGTNKITNRKGNKNKCFAAHIGRNVAVLLASGFRRPSIPP